MFVAFVVVVLAWGHYVDRVDDPCRGLSPLACVESQRVGGPFVADPGGLTEADASALAAWVRVPPGASRGGARELRPFYD